MADLGETEGCGEDYGELQYVGSVRAGSKPTEFQAKE